jgi:arginase
MATTQDRYGDTSSGAGVTLRLLWPQWQGAGTSSRVAVHFDVDTVDSNEIVLGLGAEPGGLTSAQVRRIVQDIDSVADVVGITIAEFIPRQVIHLQQLLTGFPLLRRLGG